jgi:PIN domain nuclease of toxin-antitoxin system
MSNLLLDTNALIAYASNAKRIGSKTRKLLNQSQLFYSPLSLFELKLKELRIPEFRSVVSASLLAELGFSRLSFEPQHVDGLVQLKTRDPFDLMLVAQAKISQFHLVTADLAILDSGLEFCVDLTQ